MQREESWRRTLARLSLFALIAFLVIAAVIFLAIYGAMRNPEADYTALAVGVLVNGTATLIGAAALASRLSSRDPPDPPVLNTTVTTPPAGPLAGSS